jgi:hypothetical protein
MAKKQRSKSPGKRDKAKPWLPDEKSVIEVKEVQSPAGAFRIIRTDIVDPYEKPIARRPRTRKPR